ncbi:hypothetical protein LAD12857_08600 [Lacrimispora amygdalina]|uniref:Uncharacterized protein n=1 Tax=Lacrimispora amygdalina TaxID=253257 RepID=A0A3E2NA71_9FIRM|nr:hypothetical protein DS742_16040 [Clostridium indicum]
MNKVPFYYVITFMFEAIGFTLILNCYKIAEYKLDLKLLTMQNLDVPLEFNYNYLNIISNNYRIAGILLSLLGGIFLIKILFNGNK